MQHRACSAREGERGGLLALVIDARLVLEILDGSRLTGFCAEVIRLGDGFLAASRVAAPVGAGGDRMHAVAGVLDVARVRAAGEQQHCGKDRGFHPHSLSWCSPRPYAARAHPATSQSGSRRRIQRLPVKKKALPGASMAPATNPGL